MSLVLPDLPSGVTYGTITGTFLSVLADSADAGNSPDAIALGGTVTITPVLRNFRITGSSPATVVTQDIKALIVNGTLLGPDGLTPLRVMASDSPNISPSPVQYTAKFALAGVTNQPPTVTFSVPSGGVVDLGSVISYPPVAPVVTVVSESTKNAAEAAAARAEAAANVITAPTDGVVASLVANGGSATASALLGFVASHPGEEIVANGDGTLTAQFLSAGSSSFALLDQNGQPVTNKHVVITLTADGTDIDNITVVTPV